MIKKRIALNLISAWVAKIVKLLTALYLIPLYITEIGKDGYGAIIILTTILGLSNLADLGIRQALSRQLSESIATKDFNLFNEYINGALRVYLLIWLFLSLTLFFSAPHLVSFFNIPPHLSDETIFLLRSYGILTLFWSFTTPVFSAVNVSYNRFDVNNYREAILGSVSSIALIVGIKYFNVGILGWAYISIFFQVITSVTIWYMAFKISGHIKINLVGFSKTSTQRLLRFGGLVFISQWVRKMKFDADPLIISYFIGPAAVTLYRPGVALPSHTRPLITSLSGQIHTVSTSVYAKGDFKRLLKIFLTGTKFTILFGIPMLVTFTIFGEGILQLWLGERLGPELKYTIVILQAWALIDFFFYIEGSSYAILFAMNKLKFMIFSDLALGVINIIASVLLIYFTNLGIISVVIPTVVIEFFARPFYLFYTARTIDISAKKVLALILLPGFKVLVCTTCISLTGTYLIPISSFFTLMANLFLLGISWALGSWLFALTKEDKQDILSLIKKKKNAPGIGSHSTV